MTLQQFLLILRARWLVALLMVIPLSLPGLFIGASLLSFFERIPPHGQTSVLTLYNLANATAIVTGSAIGGLLLRGFGDGRSGFAAIFLLSTAVRFLMLGPLRGVVDLEAPGPVPPLRPLSVRPSSGGEQRPVLTEEGEFRRD